MRRVALLVAVLLLLVPVTGAAQTDTAPATTDTRIHITVQDDGDAQWEVTVRMPLETDADERAFEILREGFTDGSAGETLTVDPYREAAARVSDRTGQSMQITGVDRSTEVRTVNGTDVGHLTLSFTWTSFAVTDEEQVRVGTAFEGGWFGDLGPHQTLLIEPPDGYRVHTVEPLQSIDSGILQWDGPQTFGPGQPVVTFTPAPPGPLPFAIPFTATVALIVGAILGALVLVGWRREWLRREPSTGNGPESGSTASDVESTPAEAMANSTGEEEAHVADAGAGTAAGGVVETERPAETSDDGDAETELLSDEERVERLLEKNGGRMKQARIVEETRWSNAKVSQLLSAMAAEGRVEKLRLGRENLISLPETEGEEREA